MNDSDRISILIVDDEPELLELLEAVISGHGYRVVVAKDGTEAISKLKNEEFSAVISDIRMPRLDGVRFIQHINRHNANKKPMPIIAMSGDMDNFKPELALIENVSMIEKPFSNEEILNLLEKALNPSKQVDKEDNNPKKILVKANELLMKEGEKGDVMYWLITGSLQVFQTSPEGKEIELGKIRTGELVGEMSFLDQQARSASVRAIEESELLIIPNGKFASILESQPSWFKSLVRTLSNRLRDTNKKIKL